MVITAIFRFFCFGLVLALLAMFVALNKHQMQLFFWPSAPALQIETWLVMLMVLGIGVLVGAGLFWFRVLALKAQIWRLNREKQSCEEDSAAKLSQDRPPQNTPRLIS